MVAGSDCTALVLHPSMGKAQGFRQGFRQSKSSARLLVNHIAQSAYELHVLGTTEPTDESPAYGPSAKPGTDSSTGVARPESRYRGLSNQGATCYLNSLLQSLYMTPEFRSAIFKWSYDEEKVPLDIYSPPTHTYTHYTVSVSCEWAVCLREERRS